MPIGRSTGKCATNTSPIIIIITTTIRTIQQTSRMRNTEPIENRKHDKNKKIAISSCSMVVQQMDWMDLQVRYGMEC